MRRCERPPHFQAGGVRSRALIQDAFMLPRQGGAPRHLFGVTPAARAKRTGPAGPVLIPPRGGAQSAFAASTRGEASASAVLRSRRARRCTKRWTLSGYLTVYQVRPLKTPVTLAQVKEDHRLKDMALVTSMRLSVQPVTEEEWKIVCELGGIEP